MATNRSTKLSTEPDTTEAKPSTFSRFFNRNGHDKQPLPPVKPQGPPKSVWREYFESAVVTVVMALFGMTFIVQAVKVPTGSMQNTITIGDHLLVNKFIYGLHPESSLWNLFPYRSLKRGDVIVFKYPNSPEVAYVKRLIGLPGEKVEMVGRTVYINGKPLVEDYTQYIDAGSIYESYCPFHVHDVNYFARGDHRDNSQDSRFWGFVPRDHIIGKALAIYWSYETPRDEYLQTSIPERVKQFADVFLNFFTKTRWSRTLRVIR